MVICIFSKITIAQQFNYKEVYKSWSETPVDSLNNYSIKFQAQINEYAAQNTDSAIFVTEKIVSQLIIDKKNKAVQKILPHLAYVYYAMKGNREKAIECYLKREKFFDANTTLNDSLVNKANLMFAYIDIDKREIAIDMAMEILAKKHRIDNLKAQNYFERQLTLFFEKMNMFDLAKKTALQGIKSAKASKFDKYISSFYNTLSIIYLERNEADSALYFAKIAEQELFKNGELKNLRSTYTLQANAFSKLGQYDSSLIYYEKSFTYFLKYPFYDGFLNGLSGYAPLAMAKNKEKKLLNLLDSVTANIDEFSISNTYDLLLIKEIIALSKNDFSTYIKLKFKKDSIEEIISDDRIEKLREELFVKYDTELKQAENQKLQIENDNFKRNKIYLITITFLLFVVAFVLVVLYFQQKKKRIQEKIFNEKKLQFEKSIYEERISLKEKEQQLLSDKNEILNVELRNHVNLVMRQQKVNQELKDRLNQLNESEKDPNSKPHIQMMREILNQQSENELLLELEAKAKQIYPEFLEALDEKLGKTNPGEQLLCVMILMDYSMDDIVYTLQRSEKAVRALRYRIRKKLNLEESIDLFEYLKQLAEKGNTKL